MCRGRRDAIDQNVTSDLAADEVYAKVSLCSAVGDNRWHLLLAAQGELEADGVGHGYRDIARLRGIPGLVQRFGPQCVLPVGHGGCVPVEAVRCSRVGADLRAIHEKAHLADAAGIVGGGRQRSDAIQARTRRHAHRRYGRRRCVDGVRRRCAPTSTAASTGGQHDRQQECEKAAMDRRYARHGSSPSLFYSVCTGGRERFIAPRKESCKVVDL